MVRGRFRFVNQVMEREVRVPRNDRTSLPSAAPYRERRK